MMARGREQGKQRASVALRGLGLMLELRASWGGSSAGRASRSQCEGRGFDPLPLHHYLGPAAGQNLLGRHTRMLAMGGRAPEFTLPDQDEQSVSLSTLLRHGPLILYFYPADFTAGCTREACAIRDLHVDIV